MVEEGGCGKLGVCMRHGVCGKRWWWWYMLQRCIVLTVADRIVLVVGTGSKVHSGSD